jgi:diadenosine tetraphosphate (Ap4A) HIT family hydrolase
MKNSAICRGGQIGETTKTRSMNPVTPGHHLLVLPMRHVADIFSMTEIERHEADELVRVLQGRIRAEDKKVTGFNLMYRKNKNPFQKEKRTGGLTLETDRPGLSGIKTAV